MQHLAACVRQCDSQYRQLTHMVMNAANDRFDRSIAPGEVQSAELKIVQDSDLNHNSADTHKVKLIQKANYLPNPFPPSWSADSEISCRGAL